MLKADYSKRHDQEIGRQRPINGVVEIMAADVPLFSFWLSGDSRMANDWRKLQYV